MAIKKSLPGKMPIAHSPAGTPKLQDRTMPRPSEVAGGPFANEGAVRRYQALKAAKFAKGME